jgi:prepilin-type N-terminal cleavage/methylation domain-containing protein
MKNSSIGFTLIEMIVVIAIITVLFGVSVPFYGYFQTYSAIESTKNEVSELLRLTQARAIGGKNQSNHGIYFLSDYYVLYQGDDYISRDPNYDQTFDMSNNIVFTETAEVNFEQKTGLPESAATIVLQNTKVNISEDITIAISGKIE